MATAEAALAALEDDFDQGRYTRLLGCRSLDVLHVASALELDMRAFVSFDVHQKQLARALSLKVLDLV